MEKIATAEELQTELRTLLAMAGEPEPSREKVASSLRSLAARVATTPSDQEIGEAITGLFSSDYYPALNKATDALLRINKVISAALRTVDDPEKKKLLLKMSFEVVDHKDRMIRTEKTLDIVYRGAMAFKTGIF